MSKNRLIISLVKPFLSLISSQERTNKQIVFDLQNKITFKNKQAKNIFYLNSKLNQVCLIVIPDWQFLHQVSEIAILTLQANPY